MGGGKQIGSLLAPSPRHAGDELVPYWGEDNGVSRGQAGGVA